MQERNTALQGQNATLQGKIDALKQENIGQMQYITTVHKCLKEILPPFSKFAGVLASRMTDDSDWNRIIVQDFLKALGQLDAVHRDCSVLKKRLNRGGEKLKVKKAIQEIKETSAAIMATAGNVIASGDHQVANARVVNGITITALREVQVKEQASESIQIMREVLNQEPSSQLQERRQQEQERTGSAGRQLPDREALPEKVIEPVGVPSDLCCPCCGTRGKFHVIHQSSEATLFGVVDNFVKLLKVNLLENTYAECARCGTVQPIFNPRAPMALNPKRQIAIDTLTALANLVSNGVPLNRVEDMFFKDLKT